MNGINTDDDPIVSINMQINSLPKSGATTVVVVVDDDESSRKLRGILSGGRLSRGIVVVVVPEKICSDTYDRSFVICDAAVDSRNENTMAAKN